MTISFKSCKKKVISLVFEKKEEFYIRVDYLVSMQSIHILQRARISVFPYGKLMNIVFGPIPAFILEPSLFYTKTPKYFPLLVLYIDDIFRAFKTYQKLYIFFA